MPTTPAPLRVELTYLTNVAVAESVFTFQAQKQVHPGKKWLATITLPPMKRADAQVWDGFFTSLNGPEGTFYLGDPKAETPLGYAGGTPKVNGASQVGGSLVTDGWDASITGILKAGDWLQISNRLYKVKQDVNSDGSGNATIDIFPDVRSPAPADNETIITQSCVGIFQLIENTVPLFAYGPEGVYEISFQAVEAN